MVRTPTIRLLLISAIMLATLVPDASAADVVGGDAFEGPTVQFMARPGERNDVTLTVARGFATITDHGAPLAAAGRCVRTAPDTVRCDVSSVKSLEINLGDANDRLAASWAPGPALPIVTTYRGGPGDDVMRGGRAREYLVGGRGRDHLDGGPGPDQLDSSERENASTGRLGTSDDVRCGAGDDVLFGYDVGDVLHPDCERALALAHGLGAMPIRPRVPADHAGMAWTLSCMRIGNDRRSTCSATIAVRDTRGHLLGRGHGSIRTRGASFIRIRHAKFRVALKLTPRGRRVMKRRGGFEAVVRVDSFARVPGAVLPSRVVSTYTTLLGS